MGVSLTNVKHSIFFFFSKVIRPEKPMLMLICPFNYIPSMTVPVIIATLTDVLDGDNNTSNSYLLHKHMPDRCMSDW